MRTYSVKGTDPEKATDNLDLWPGDTVILLPPSFIVRTYRVDRCGQLQEVK